MKRESALDADGFARLSGAFHDLVAQDPVLSKLFPRNLTAQSTYLGLFLDQTHGASTTYKQRRGKQSLVCRHAHLAIGPEEIASWLACMDRALDQMPWPDPAKQKLRDYFHATAPTLGDPLLPYYSLPLEELRELLAASPHLAQANEAGRTLLARAARDWDLDRVCLLLKSGADVHAQDLAGHDALYHAANAHLKGREAQGRAVVRELIEAGADVGRVTGPKKVTALHMAARRGNALIAEVLIMAGANPLARDSGGVTPRQRAINCRQGEFVEQFDRLTMPHANKALQLWLRRVAPDSQKREFDFYEGRAAYIVAQTIQSLDRSLQCRQAGRLSDMKLMVSLLEAFPCSQPTYYLFRGKTTKKWFDTQLHKTLTAANFSLAVIDNVSRVTLAFVAPPNAIEALKQIPFDLWEDYAFATIPEPLSQELLEDIAAQTDREVWRKLERIQVLSECLPLFWEGRFDLHAWYPEIDNPRIEIFPGFATITEVDASGEGKIPGRYFLD